MLLKNNPKITKKTEPILFKTKSQNKVSRLLVFKGLLIESPKSTISITSMTINIIPSTNDILANTIVLVFILIFY